MERKEIIEKLYTTFTVIEAKSVIRFFDNGFKGLFLILRFLRDSGVELSAGDLAKKLGLSTARVAVMIRNLKDKGYIQRLRSQTDGRKVVVSITPCGLKALERREKELFDSIDFLLSKLSDEEGETFFCILQKLLS